MVPLLRVVAILSVCTMLMIVWSEYEFVASSKSVWGNEITRLVLLVLGNMFFWSLVLVAFFGFKCQVQKSPRQWSGGVCV